MKAIGIEIDKKRAICFALEKNDEGNFINLTGKVKYFEIDDDHNNAEIQNFMTTIHAYFDTINPDYIAVISRQTKGKFASSPLSFKLEGLIQCYQKIDITFVAKVTLTAYFKKNTFPDLFDNNYQENASKLAGYILR